MKTIAYGALALALASTSGYAADTGWSGLDQEIDSLSASLAAQNTSAPKVGGWVITSLRHNKDEQVSFGADPDGAGPLLPPTNDKFGFQLDAVRIEVRGDLTNDYSYKVAFDLNSGAAQTGVVLKDAYAEFKIADGIKGRMGRYKMPFLRSALISDNKLLFLERTALGEGTVLGVRDIGFSVAGSFETVNFWVNAQNGFDGQGDDWFYNGRVTADLMGTGSGMVEGAYGAGDEVNLTVGAAIGDDTAVDKGLFWALEGSVASGPFSLAAEIADFDDDVAKVHPISGAGIANTTPWDITASYMFTDMYELGVRYEDSDNDAKAYGAVVNRYMDGHNIKWQLQFRHFDFSTVGAEDSDELGLGLAVTF